ncbi:hypothetical protein D3C86_1679840 [compost metagenome]
MPSPARWALRMAAAMVDLICSDVLIFRGISPLLTPLTMLRISDGRNPVFIALSRLPSAVSAKPR